MYLIQRLQVVKNVIVGVQCSTITHVPICIYKNYYLYTLKKADMAFVWMLLQLSMQIVKSEGGALVKD